MRYVPVLFAALLSTLSCFAQESGQYRTCTGKAKTQSQLNVCASEEAARVDAELNNVYQSLLSKAASELQATAKIKSAERAWVAYRDAYINAMYPAEDKQAEYGSTYPMDVDLLRAELTRQQIVALRKLLAQYST